MSKKNETFGKKKAEKVWGRIFPIREGDKVRVIMILSTNLNVRSELSEYIGKTGVAFSIKQTTYIETPLGYPAKTRQVMVNFPNTKRKPFREEELERIE